MSLLIFTEYYHTICNSPHTHSIYNAQFHYCPQCNTGTLPCWLPADTRTGAGDTSLIEGPGIARGFPITSCPFWS